MSDADRLLLETDCPFLTPLSCEGKQCQSPMIAVTAGYVARAMGKTEDEILRHAAENAGRLFGIDIDT